MSVSGRERESERETREIVSREIVSLSLSCERDTIVRSLSEFKKAFRFLDIKRAL